MKAIKKYYYIYKITNLINNMIYIGQHSTDNLDDGYMGGGRKLTKDQKKYGKHHFKKEILEFCSDSYELDKREQEIVNKEFVMRSDTYNQKTGGNQKSWYCESTREKMREKKKNYVPWNKGKHNIYSEETIQKMRDAKKGYVPWSKGRSPSKETREKLSKAMKGRFVGEKSPMWGKRGEQSPSWGRHLSEEAKAKLSRINKGKILSEETRRLISEAQRGEKAYNWGKHLSEATKEKLRLNHLGKKLSEETKKKISLSRKGQPSARKNLNPILQIDIDTGDILKEWDNVHVIHENLGYATYNILKTCRGKQKTSNGFKWRFK